MFVEKKSDKLFEIFSEYLNDLSRPQQTDAELIYDVVASYIYHLMNEGNIPEHFLDQLEFDLTEEVTQMYQKKTYGFLSLQEYRDTRVKSSH